MILRRAIAIIALWSSATAAQPPADSAAPARRVMFLPVLGSAPETGFQYGIAVFSTRPHAVEGTRPRALTGNVVYTAKSQLRAFVEYDRWSANNDRRFQMLLIGQQFPRDDYGRGDRTTDDDLIPFTQDGTDATYTYQQRWRGATWWTASLRFTNATQPSDEGYVPPPCGPPALGCPAVGYPVKHASTAYLQLGAIRDTRDLLFAPTSGRFVEFGVGVGNEHERSGRTFPRVRVDARRYRGLRNGGVLATQATLTATSDAAPYEYQGLVGGAQTMRGYDFGRFRDLNMVAAQAEYRSPLRGKWGVAAFGGGGLLAPTVSDFGKSRLLPTFGAGLRYRLDPRTGGGIRLDYAFGTTGQRGLYIAFNEAF